MSTQQTPEEIYQEQSGRGAEAATDTQDVVDEEETDAPEVTEAPPAEEDTQAAELDRLRAERDEAQEKLLRQAAEFQNYKKRQARERAQLVDVGQGQVMLPMLEVLDDLERSLNAADEFEQQASETGPAFISLRDGVQQVRQKFLDELKRLGVEPIDAEGEPFDEHLHEAMLQQPAPEGTEPGTVLQEVRKGYRQGERVLRHSQVIVAS